MSTSGTYTFTVTRDDIIREAMLNCGKLGESETPTAQEVTDCARKLNMMVKQWMGRLDFAPGLKIWTRRTGELFLDQTKNQYNLGPSGDNWTTSPNSRQTTAAASLGASSITVSNIANATNGDFIGIQLSTGNLQWTTINGAPSGSTINLAATLTASVASGAYVYNYTTKAQRPLEIETAYLRDNFNSDTPLKTITKQDYDLLPSKQQIGYLTDPTLVYYEAQLTNGILYTDVTGAFDVTKRIRIGFLEPIQDFNNPLDNPEYPQEWFMALCWGLTKQIAPMFNVPFTKDMEENLIGAVSSARESYPQISSLFFQPGTD
jgi:hypothetical protein